jgi:hypothetical protein
MAVVLKLMTLALLGPQGGPPGRSSWKRKVPPGDPDAVTEVRVETEVQPVLPEAITALFRLDAGTMTSRVAAAVALAVPGPLSLRVVRTV